MAHFLFADCSISFDGRSLTAGPLGGAESAFIEMCQALARRGHKVSVYNKCAAPLEHNGVSWRPIGSDFPPETVDVYVANRNPHLLPLLPEVKRRLFWIHNPAGHLLKWRYFSRLAWYKPRIVFSGAHHAGTYPAWAPPWRKDRDIIVPYGISGEFLHSAERAPPAPKVMFTSNPLRSLDWLLNLWAKNIHPAVPNAELHIFSGAATYKAEGTALGGKMEQVLNMARAMADKGVHLRAPLPKPQLVEEWKTARAILYRGDVGETFCLALGEAQAIGVPAVVQPVGCVAERVRDGETGYVTTTDPAFAERAAQILKDDGLWRRLHQNALRLQQSWNWDRAAAELEKNIL